jgi:tetratricopeptide (TPR) repeat protein
MGDQPNALKYHLKALVIRKKVLDSQHPSTATSYNNIGETYRATGDHSKALEYHLKALVIWERVLGKQHPATATGYNNIGVTYGAMSDHTNAYHYAKKAFTIFLQQRDNNFAVLDNAQKKQYLTANERWIDFLLLHANRYQKTLLDKKSLQQATQLEQATLNDWLAYKGSLLDSENRLISLAKTSKDPVIQQKYQQLVQHKQMYATLYQRYPIGNKGARLRRKNTLALYQQKITTLEQEITQAANFFFS